jgi:hypothetical protein
VFVFAWSSRSSFVVFVFCVRLRVVVSFVVRCFRVCVRLRVVGELNG